jgi:hypothetical protein
MALMAPAGGEGQEAVCVGLELWLGEGTNRDEQLATSGKGRYSLIARRAGGSWGLRHSDLWLKASLVRDQLDASEFEGTYRTVLDPIRFPAFLALFDYVGYAQPASALSFFFDDMDREVGWSELPTLLLAHAVEGREVLRQKPHPSLDELVALSYLDEVGESRKVDSLGVFANSLGVAVTALTKVGGPLHDHRWELLRSRLLTEIENDLGPENSVHVFSGPQFAEDQEETTIRIFFNAESLDIDIELDWEPIRGTPASSSEYELIKSEQEAFQSELEAKLNLKALEKLGFRTDDSGLFTKQTSDSPSPEIRAFLVLTVLRDIANASLECDIFFEPDSFYGDESALIWGNGQPHFEA